MGPQPDEGFWKTVPTLLNCHSEIEAMDEKSWSNFISGLRDPGRICKRCWKRPVQVDFSWFFSMPAVRDSSSSADLILSTSWFSTVFQLVSIDFRTCSNYFSLVVHRFLPTVSPFCRQKNDTSGSDLAGQIFLEAGAPHVVPRCEDADLKILFFLQAKIAIYWWFDGDLLVIWWWFNGDVMMIYWDCMRFKGM